MLHVKLYSKGLDFSLKLKNLLISLSIKEIMIVAIFGTCRIIMIENLLTHFRPMFHLRRNQVVGFY